MATKPKAKSAKAAKRTTIPSLSHEDTVRAVPRTCKGPLKDGYRAKIDAALAKGDRQGSSRLDTEGRAGCGLDVNDLILKAGLDGEEHSQDCPKCGQTLTWRAPRFD